MSDVAARWAVRRTMLPLPAPRILVIAAWVTLWWAVVTALHIRPEFLPTPWEVLRRIALLAVFPIGDGPLWIHVAWSAIRFVLGFLLATVVGLPLGFAMGYVRRIDWLVTPVFDLLRCVPPIAWAPFALLWFGPSLGAQAFVIFTSALPPIVLSAERGFRLIDRNLLEAVRSLGARPVTIMWEVAIPSSIPVLVSGLRIGLASGWMALVGAEIIAGDGTHSGLGYLILIGQQTLHADLTIGAMAIIGVLGALLDWGLRRAEKRASTWRLVEEGGHG